MGSRDAIWAEWGAGVSEIGVVMEYETLETKNCLEPWLSLGGRGATVGLARAMVCSE